MIGFSFGFSGFRYSNIAAAIVCLTGAVSAHADEASLRAQISELAAKVEALQAQQKQLENKVAVTPPVAQPNPDVVTKGDLPGSFKLPGTNTSIKIGGSTRLDAIWDVSGGGMGGSLAMIPQIPLSGSPGSTREMQTTLTARATRFQLSSLTPTTYGDLKTYIETDFYGAGGSELATTSSALRLRQAYAEMGPWLVGNAYTTFFDGRTIPEVVDFGGPHAAPAGLRVGQIRYTKNFGADELSLGIENPEGGDINGAPSPTFVAGIGPNNATLNFVDKAPDILAKYAINRPWGRIAVSGVARYLTFNNKGAAAINGFVGESSAFAGGLNISGTIKTVGADAFIFSLGGGPGLGRYMTGNLGNAAVISGGVLKTVRTRAASFGYKHVWTSNLRSTFSYGTVRADNPHPALPLTAISRADAVRANLIWNPMPNTSMGVEYTHGRVKNDAQPTAALSNRGKASRFSISGTYAF